MPMSSRERVLTVFDHKEPDRVPAWCGASPEFWSKAKQALNLDDEGLRVRWGDDFRRVFARYAGPEVTLPAGANARSIFGVYRSGIGYGQPMSHPLEGGDIDAVHGYDWPKPEWMDVSHIREEAEAHGRRYAILGGDWSPFWHDAIDLLGMRDLFLMMYDAPEVVEALLSHIVDFYLAVSRRIFEAAGDAIDIFFMGNDFGSQMGPLLSRDLFDRFMLPHLERLARLGHDFGLKVMLHCCGGFEPLIEPMIQAGIDGFHAVQPCCAGMDLAALKAKYGERAVFNGAIDSHHVLIDGNPETVREKTREVLSVMMPGGGFIAGASHDTILEETPVENVTAMFDAIREFGVYGS